MNKENYISNNNKKETQILKLIPRMALKNWPSNNGVMGPGLRTLKP